MLYWIFSLLFLSFGGAKRLQKKKGGSYITNRCSFCFLSFSSFFIFIFAAPLQWLGIRLVGDDGGMFCQNITASPPLQISPFHAPYFKFIAPAAFLIYPCPRSHHPHPPCSSPLNLNQPPLPPASSLLPSPPLLPEKTILNYPSSRRCHSLKRLMQPVPAGKRKQKKTCVCEDRRRRYIWEGGSVLYTYGTPAAPSRSLYPLNNEEVNLGHDWPLWCCAFFFFFLFQERFHKPPLWCWRNENGDNSEEIMRIALPLCVCVCVLFMKIYRTSKWPNKRFNSAEDKKKKIIMNFS